MRARPMHSSRTLLGCLSTVALLASCSGDPPTSVNPDLASKAVESASGFSICHGTGTTGTIIQVSASELGSHRKHGDYLTSLFVSQEDGQPSDEAHFRHIGDAYGAARNGRLARGELQSGACRITIAVATGVYPGTDDAANKNKSLEHFPLVVDVPDITLRGALVMGLDASGRATGAGATQVATTLSPIAPLSDQGGDALFLVLGDPAGSAGNGFTVEGFVLRSGSAPGTDPIGFGLLALAVNDVLVQGNRLEGFFEALDLRGSSGVVKANHVSGSGQCDVCIAGPGNYRVADNRILAGATHGIFASPAIDSDPSIAPTSEIVADIVNNEVRDHRQQPISAGIRIGTVGLGAPDVHGTSHITVRDNLLANNNFGLLIDALFPQPDTELRGDVDLTTSGNVVRQSCQADLLVTFARHTTALGITGGIYLRKSTYRLTLGGDLPFGDAWFSNPGGLGNTLLVDGHAIGHITRQFFDPNSCPGATLASARGTGGR
jgi:hypothetical protein